MKLGNIYISGTNRVHAHEGEGQIDFARLLGTADNPLPPGTSLNFVDLAILPPGTSIGRHTHRESTEVYLLVEGRGKYLDDNKWIEVKTGDVLVNHCAQHSLINNSNKPLKIFVVEVGTVTKTGTEIESKNVTKTGGEFR
ncbi:MAG: cupin domain-containing protein [bacterium]|nr:cupin domain-containing protein [bacterium]